MHHHKVCTFLHNSPKNHFQTLGEPVLRKLTEFAQRAWDIGDFSGIRDRDRDRDRNRDRGKEGEREREREREEGGNIEGKEIRAIAPLYKLTGGVDSLFLRLAEHWQYSAGGGLVDPEHYDNNSVLTIVSMLSDPEDCDGGVCRTHEPDGSMKEHPLSRGDVICFVSHKLHNVTPLLVSLDLEL